MWAVCRLADCFVKFVPKSKLEDHLHGFYVTLELALAKAVQRRLGIAFETADDKRDVMLARQFFSIARASDRGFDQIFHDLYGGVPRCEGYDEVWAPLLDTLSGARLVWPNAFQHSHFKQPFAVSLKIDEVEELWAPIATEDNWQPLAEKISAIRTMRAALDGVAITTMPKIYGGALLKD